MVVKFNFRFGSHKGVEETLPKKPRIPPLFVQPGDDWSTLLAILRTIALNLRSKLQQNFLKLMVESETEFRTLTAYMDPFKTFNLKGERPVKVVFRGLPTSTLKEAIAAAVEATGFHVVKIDQLTRRGNNKKLPLFYLQVEPCEDISDIHDMTEVLGIAVKVVPYEGRKGNLMRKYFVVPYEELL